jgi:hypothetical protein
MWVDGEHRTHPQPLNATGAASTVERRLESADGLLAGVVDRVELIGGRCRIVDYKTSLAKDEEGHARQIKLYAYLWFDRYGTWPDDGLVVYVLLRQEVPVMIDPVECTELANEARQEARMVLVHPPKPERLGNPGPACAFCEFRPWCRAFWPIQAMTRDDHARIEQAQAGFEAIVSTAQTTGTVVLAELEAIGRTVEIRLLLSQFPHLAGIKPGDRLRVLDARLLGVVGRPTADVTERTEIYRVLNNPREGR